MLFDGAFRLDLFAGAVGFNVLFVGGAAAYFLHTFRVARQRGLLLQQGE